MQNQKEITQINNFLRFTAPLIISQVKMLLLSTGMEVKEEGRGADLAFVVKSGEKEIKFFLQNLLLEIATVDRDEKSLRFDKRLRDFDFFLAKSAQHIESKLRILFQVLSEDDIDVALENLSRCADQYERIRIWRFDKDKPTSSRQ